MVLAPFRQTNFAGGRLGPQLLGRTDHAKYQAGLAEVRNCTIQRFSGVENRAGFRWCGATKASAFQGQPWQTAAGESFSLEQGAGYIRLWQNGAPLLATGVPEWTPSVYTPAGQVVHYGGSYFYCVAEQYGQIPIALTITDPLGTYLPGATVTLTSVISHFSQDICYAGTVYTFQVPGGPIVRVTTTGYTSSTSCTGTVDAAVPTYLQGQPTIWWEAEQPVYLPQAMGNDSITLTVSGASYAAGATLTLTSNANIFSGDWIITGGAHVPVTLYTDHGIITVTLTGVSNRNSAVGVANADIPASISGVAFGRFALPDMAGTTTWSPFGPNLPPAPSLTSIVITSSTTFLAGQTLILTASLPIFNAGMVSPFGQAIAFKDTLGNVITCVMTGYNSPTQVQAVSTAAIPTSMQGVPLTYWSMATQAPGNTGASALFWHQMLSAQVEIPTQVAARALGAIVAAQVNDIMTFTHQSFAPFQLLHYSSTRWQIRNYRPQPGIAPPTGLLLSGINTSSSHAYDYVVTAISDATGEESLASVPNCILTGTPSSSQPNTLSWKPVPGASGYNVYLSVGGVFGLIGSVPAMAGCVFVDTGFVPDIAAQPPVSLSLFATPNDYPAVCGAFQQRLGFANTIDEPQTIVFTEAGLINSVTVHTPLRDSDAIQETIAGDSVQPIQAIVDLQKLVLHTSNAEYVVVGNVNGAISPVTGSFNVVRQSSNGCASVRPVTIGITDLFVQARGQMLRDLKYDIRSYCYASSDLTEFSPDLFIGRTIVRTAWQQTKNSLVWVVMSDGALLSLTYIPGEGIVAWATHDSAGDRFVDVWTVQEGVEDVVYVGVVRNGQTYIERLAQREFTDTAWLTDAYFPDSFQVYDGRNATATTITVTTSSDWTPQSQFTLTASAAIFAASDAPDGNPQGMGNCIVLRQVGPDGNDTARVYFAIQQYLSATQVLCITNANVPAWAQAALTTWGKAVHAFGGMGHLEGRSLAILADGNVAASPLSTDKALAATVVQPSGGAWVLPGARVGGDAIAYNAMVVCAGLPVLAQLTTLPLENQKGDSIIGHQKTIKEFTPTFYRSRGGWYGQVPEGIQTIALNAWKQRNYETLGSPNALFSGSQRVDGITSNWGLRGAGTAQLVLQQPDPLPLGLSAVKLVAEVGG
jgi:hypothetical protein